VSARILYWIFTVCLILTTMGTIVAFGFVAIAPVVGQPLITGFTLANELREDDRDYNIELNLETELSIREASLTIVFPGLTAGFLRVIDVIISGGIVIFTLYILRQFFRNMFGDRPFSHQSTAKLSIVGVLLILFPVWQLTRSFAWQSILFHFTGPTPKVIPMFGSRFSETQWRILPEVDPFIALVGLVLLVMAKAFRIGTEIQQDNDEIV
jgi:hypothetical protein